MENNLFGSNPFESSSEDSEKPDKTSKKSDKKHKAERDLAKSIDKSPLIERPKATVEAEPEKSIEAVQPEEKQHLQQEIASDHLTAIEQAEPEAQKELEPATDFLEQVSQGEDPKVAFSKVAAEAGLSEDEIAEELENVDELPVAEPEDMVVSTAESSEGEFDWRAASPAPRRASPIRPVAPAIIAGSVVGGAAAQLPNTLPSNANTYYQDRSSGSDLLLIGLVGYLIGRRRGRIRTEKKLLPVQQKLEKQVKQLEQDITQKEQKLVAITAQKRQAEARPTLAPVERAQPGRQETRLGMEKPVRAERLGHMAMAAGEAPRKTVERTSEKVFDTEHVASMSRNELLEISEKIIVEGASLRRIYESHLIGEKQLRHLVSEHLQGRDIRKDLRREMVEHEIDFERDPILRDRVRSQLTSKEGGGLGEMLAKAGITTDASDMSPAQRARYEEKQEQAVQRESHRRRAVVDLAMVTAIVVLASMVTILVLGE